MGSYKNVYIGVYLKVPFLKGEEVKVSYKHPETGKKMSSKFCPQTGVECEKVKTTIPKTIYPSPYIEDVEGYDEDMFTCADVIKNVSLFLLNESGRFSFFDDEPFCKDFTESPETLIEDFKVEYAKYLDYYRNLYGEFEIHYGAVLYYN